MTRYNSESRAVQRDNSVLISPSETQDNSSKKFEKSYKMSNSGESDKETRKHCRKLVITGPNIGFYNSFNYYGNGVVEELKSPGMKKKLPPCTKDAGFGRFIPSYQQFVILLLITLVSIYVFFGPLKYRSVEK